MPDQPLNVVPHVATPLAAHASLRPSTLTAHSIHQSTPPTPPAVERASAAGAFVAAISVPSRVDPLRVPEHPTGSDQAPTHRVAESGNALDDRAWDHLVDKISQTALLIVATKLLSAWAIVALWGIPIHSRLVWGVIPYAGLQASPAQFRTVAAWSTAATAVVASLWLLTHFLMRKRRHPMRAWAAASAVLMSALLTLFEWYRRFDADHLIPTAWLVRILIFLGVSAVLFLGFIELPGGRTGDTSEEKRPVSLPTFTTSS